MSARPGFDVEHFRSMTGDDQTLQAELVHMFSAQAVLWRRLLVADAPVHTWRDAAHTLKGSARGLGLWRLAEACAEAEALARSGAKDGPKVAQALTRLRATLDEAVQALETTR